MSKLALGLLVAALITPQERERRTTPRDHAVWLQMTYRDALDIARAHDRSLLRIDIIPKFEAEPEMDLPDVTEPGDTHQPIPANEQRGMGENRSLEFIMLSVLGREDVREDLDRYAVVIVDHASLPGGGRLVPDATTVRYTVFTRDGRIVRSIEEDDVDDLGDALNEGNVATDAADIAAPIDGEIVYVRLPPGALTRPVRP